MLGVEDPLRKAPMSLRGFKLLFVDPSSEVSLGRSGDGGALELPRDCGRLLKGTFFGLSGRTIAGGVFLRLVTFELVEEGYSFRSGLGRRDLNV